MDADFLKSISQGLEEAQKGLVSYASTSYLTEELNDLWNPRPIVREEDATSFNYSKQARIAAALMVPPAQTNRPPPWFVGMSSAFSKDVVKIDRKLQGRILQALVEITKSPTEVRGDTVKPLSGDLKGCWRYRVGDYRIIYSPDKNTGDVTLLAFDARGSAYAA